MARRSQEPLTAVGALAMVARGCVILVVVYAAFRVVSCQMQNWYRKEAAKLEERQKPDTKSTGEKAKAPASK